MASSALSRLVNIQRHFQLGSRRKGGKESEGICTIKLSPEVSEALSHGRAVVALESTIISHGSHEMKLRGIACGLIVKCSFDRPFHAQGRVCLPELAIGIACLSQKFRNLIELQLVLLGLSNKLLRMPYPQNLETAKEVEAIVRENRAVPATVAILDGVPCVGLTAEELERLANLGTKSRKTACRDIAHVVATGGNGATTVSATMIFASLVGISVFVTGGIGGVHRHGENTMDISSDLTELGRTPIAVISAGVKSILDIPRTLEYLETQGVCVAAYKTDEFPAFFTETSGYKAPCRIDTSEDYANMKLKLGTGILIAVPIPKEHSASGSLIESAIQRALKEARDKGVTGNAETPFLLARVNELTGGASLSSSILSLDIQNIALVKNNALVGAKIAVSLAQMREGDHRGDTD
ncbi:indigoidine synthase A family protein [Actinidia rufa]|uniref:Indigoidine synthase A family protein n=1 Tax=Actinidia rufa TaxID=165716 RepID=A0A7J0HC90_9ERIC|nr:indigoidine synthase A family protein [Actinidia rufa]